MKVRRRKRKRIRKRRNKRRMKLLIQELKAKKKNKRKRKKMMRWPSWTKQSKILRKSTNKWVNSKELTMQIPC